MVLRSARRRQARRIARAADGRAPRDHPAAADAAILRVPHVGIVSRPPMAGILVAMHAEPSPTRGGVAAESFRRRVDDEVERALAARRDQVATFAPEALVLIDEIARLFRAGGKRLRPLFCLWGHLGGGGVDGPEIVRAGAAVEVLHLSALMHDDVMDRAHLRRGAPPSFRLLAGSNAPSGAFGQAAAILAGDLRTRSPTSSSPNPGLLRSASSEHSAISTRCGSRR